MNSPVAMYSSLGNDEVLPEDNLPSNRKKSCYRALIMPQKGFLKKTKDDLRTWNWKLLMHGLPVILILALIATIVIMAAKRQLNFPKTICRPDGTVINGNTTYNPWKSSETFTINLSFGDLKYVPFKTAKLVDAISDIIIGRGGQGLLAVVSYRVSVRTLSRLMEKQAVSYGVFEAVTLQQNSVTSFGKLVRDFWRNEGARSKATIVWLLFSAAALLIYPTLASAMTGYSANVNAQIPLPNGTRVPATNFQSFYYIIHDASRMGSEFYDDYTVTDHHSGDPSSSSIPYCYVSASRDLADCRKAFMSDCSNFAPGKFNSKTNTTTVSWKSDFGPRTDCALLWDVSQYASIYGLNGLNKTASSFNNSATGKLLTFGSPILNISAFSYMNFISYPSGQLPNVYNNTPNAWALMPFGVAGSANTSISTIRHYPNSSDQFFGKYSFKDKYRNPPQDYIREYADLTSSASCQQQAQDSLSQSPIQYRWGFSYQLLLAFLILLLVWTIGKYVMHMDVYMNSRLALHQREIGLRRAILDISAKYEQRLEGQEGIAMKSDKDLKKVIGNEQFTYDSLLVIDDSTRRERLTAWWEAFNIERWAKQEIRWLIAFFVFTLLWGLSWWQFSDWAVLIWDPYVGWLPSFGVLIVLMMGKAHFARWIIFATLFDCYLTMHFTAVGTTA